MESLTFVIPAYNEADRIGELLSNFALKNDQWNVIVVDNNSTDHTRAVAESAGAFVLSEPRRGKGFAVVAGALFATTSHIFLCDADVAGFDPTLARELLATREPDEILARLSLERPPELAPVSFLCASPLLQSLGHQLPREPLGGLALVKRDFLLDAHLPGHWGFDVSLTLAAASPSRSIREVAVPYITHRPKPLVEYREMAEEVCLAILRSYGIVPWDHGDCVRCRRAG